MDKLNRRSMLQLLGAAPVAAGFTWTAVGHHHHVEMIDVPMHQ